MVLLAGSQGGFWIAISLLLVAIALGASGAQLGTTGGAEPGGRALRGAGAARTGPASSRRLALAALAALAGPRRHRQRGDCADRDRVRDRTKTRTFNDQHVARVEAIASWLRARRRRWCPEGALAVLCVVHARRLERVDAGVLIVSLDRLVGALRTVAGTRQRPRFLAGPASPQPKQGWESSWNGTQAPSGWLAGAGGSRRKGAGSPGQACASHSDAEMRRPHTSWNCAALERLGSPLGHHLARLLGSGAST